MPHTSGFVDCLFHNWGTKSDMRLRRLLQPSRLQQPFPSKLYIEEALMLRVCTWPDANSTGELMLNLGCLKLLPRELRSHESKHVSWKLQHFVHHPVSCWCAVAYSHQTAGGSSWSVEAGVWWQETKELKRFSERGSPQSKIAKFVIHSKIVFIYDSSMYQDSQQHVPDL